MSTLGSSCYQHLHRGHCLPTRSCRQSTWNLVSAKALLLLTVRHVCSTQGEGHSPHAASESRSALIWEQELLFTDHLLQIGAKPDTSSFITFIQYCGNLQRCKVSPWITALAFVDSTNLRSIIFFLGGGEGGNLRKFQKHEAKLATHWGLL